MVTLLSASTCSHNAWNVCPDYDWSEEGIHALLNPNDAQDVPRAVKLLSLITEFTKLHASQFNPGEQTTLNALWLLGSACNSLLQPFVNPTTSLSEQVTLLTRFGHLIFALHQTNGSSFMPNQLYYDLQAMIKNVIFTVAKTKALNPELEVFFSLMGDDVLETLFGQVCMIGGHIPNFNLKELADCLGLCQLLDTIFQRHPEWERKLQHLRLD